jgi:hypothetical protein
MPFCHTLFKRPDKMAFFIGQMLPKNRVWVNGTAIEKGETAGLIQNPHTTFQTVLNHKIVKK